MDINELKAKHPGIDLYEVVVEELPEPIYIRKPTRAEMRRKDDEIGRLGGGNKSLFAVLQNFVRSCVVSPTWDRCVEMFEQYPAMEDILLSKLTDLAGANLSVTLKKV